MSTQTENQAAEAAAKAAWEALTPAEGTIEWYDKFFAEMQHIPDRPFVPDSRYYRTLMEILNSYENERQDFNDDEAWLAILRENYMELAYMTAEFERDCIAEKSGSTGHVIGLVIAGETR